MDPLVDFIKIYDNALDKSICDILIQVFENNNIHQEVVENERKPNFKQLNLTRLNNISDDFTNIHQSVLKVVLDYKKKYYDFVYKECFPSTNAFEQIRIKKYEPNKNEAFDTHVDVNDYETSRRFLSFIFYLNDVNDGGETMFKDLTIEPRQGRLVMFPPLWMFPHCGKEPLSNSKYILSTYLHYK